MRPIGLFCCLTFLVAFTYDELEIRCNFRLATWENLGTLYTCRASVTSMENPSIITKISGVHLVDKANEDVKDFWILENNSEGHRNLLRESQSNSVVEGKYAFDRFKPPRTVFQSLAP